MRPTHYGLRSFRNIFRIRFLKDQTVFNLVLGSQGPSSAPSPLRWWVGLHPLPGPASPTLEVAASTDILFLYKNKPGPSGFFSPWAALLSKGGKPQGQLS